MVILQPHSSYRSLSKAFHQQDLHITHRSDDFDRVRTAMCWSSLSGAMHVLLSVGSEKAETMQSGMQADVLGRQFCSNYTRHVATSTLYIVSWCIQ